MNKYTLKNNTNDILILYGSIQNNFIIFKSLWEKLYNTKNKINNFKN